MRPLIAALLLTTLYACRAFSSQSEWASPSGVPKLDEAAKALQSMLDRTDQQVAVVARRVATTGLSGPDTREVLRDACKSLPIALNCCTIDARGRIIAVEPAAYDSIEGENVSGQEHVIRVQRTGRPVLSQAFRAVEGFDAVALQHPVLSDKGKLLGAVSLLMRPESLVSIIEKTFVQGTPMDLWAMQPDGRILYDPEAEEVGRNLLTDPAYRPYRELVLMAQRIASTPAGTGTYTAVRAAGRAAPIQHRATWRSVSDCTGQTGAWS